MRSQDLIKIMNNPRDKARHITSYHGDHFGTFPEIFPEQYSGKKSIMSSTGNLLSNIVSRTINFLGQFLGDSSSEERENSENNFLGILY